MVESVRANSTANHVKQWQRGPTKWRKYGLRFSRTHKHTRFPQDWVTRPSNGSTVPNGHVYSRVVYDHTASGTADHAQARALLSSFLSRPNTTPLSFVSVTTW